jgi:hypothetical protein
VQGFSLVALGYYGTSLADIIRADQEFHPEIIRGCYAILLRFTHDIGSSSYHVKHCEARTLHQHNLVTNIIKWAQGFYQAEEPSDCAKFFIYAGNNI